MCTTEVDVVFVLGSSPVTSSGRWTVAISECTAAVSRTPLLTHSRTTLDTVLLWCLGRLQMTGGGPRVCSGSPPLHVCMGLCLVFKVQK